MVEAYKSRELQNRKSARDQLNTLAKDTAAKVNMEKPKKTAKTKGLEL